MDSTITLNVINEVKSNPREVAEIFNKHFINVAADIGNDITDDNLDNHPNVEKISSFNNAPESKFENVEVTEIKSIIDKLKVSKLTGVDGISARLIKSCSESISPVITNLITANQDTSLVG